MYKHLTIDDFIQFDIYNNNKCKLIITNNKLNNNCDIYIYEIIKKNKLYYLYYFVKNYNSKNILIHYYINNIEQDFTNKIDLNSNFIGSYKTLNYILEYINNTCNTNHKYHYLIYNSNKYKKSTIYNIHTIETLLHNKNKKK